MKNNLPTFEFIIDDSLESGVKGVSIVTEPAFGSAALRFDEQQPKPKFLAFGEKKKQIVAGFLILANTPVYRVDPEFGEYMGYFSPETITKIIEKYHAEMNSNKVNLDHDSEAYIDAFMIEDYQVNSEARVQDLASRGLKHPNALGSWYGAMKIKDPAIFEAIDNSGEMTGFSVEAFLDRVMVDFNAEVKNNIIKNKVSTEMRKISKTIKEKILSIFTEIEKFERALVPELAFEIEWTVVGEPVNQVIPPENVDGEEQFQPVGQGEFVTEYGIVVVDEASLLVEVRELPAEIQEPEAPEVEDELAVDEDGNPIVESPEVPASGDTASSGSTETIAEIVDVVDPELPAPTGVTETVTDEVVVEVPMAGIEKSILEVVGTVDGQYTILVTVAGGVVTEAIAQSMVDLMLEKQKEIDALVAEKQVLLEKMKDPITDPILTPAQQEADFKKMTAYEKLMYKRGLKAV